MQKEPRHESMLRIPYDLWEKIAHIAKKRTGNVNAYIQLLIQKEVEQYEREHGPISTQGED